MATRFYLPSSGAAAVNPAFNGWTRSSEGDRLRMVSPKGSTALTSKTFGANATIAANGTVLNRQYVSDPLIGGIAFATTDTIKLVLRCQESAANDNINRTPISLRVYSSDGSTLRATLKALGHYGPNTTEWGTALATKQALDGDVLDANYTTVSGDRLVLEIGGQCDATGGTSVTGTQSFGENGASDHLESEGVTTALNPWFEISRTVTFATPQTATPGTLALSITGLAPTVAISANQRVTPPTLALTLTGFAPSVAASTNVVTVPTLHLHVTTSAFSDDFNSDFGPRQTFAPSVVQGTNATPPTLALALTGFAPSVALTSNQVVTPGVLALTLTRFAPVVSTPQPQVATPPTLALVLTRFAPSVLLAQTVTPGTLTLVITTYAPSVTVSDNRTATPGTLALVLTGFAPVIRLGVSPPTLALVLTTFAPVISTPRLVTVPTLALSITAFAPTVQTPTTVTPPTLALVLTTFAPTVSVTTFGPVTVTPGTLALVLTGFAPTVSVTSSSAYVPGTLALTITTFAPTIVTPQTVTVGRLALTLTLFAPTVLTPRAVTPGTLALSITTFAPTVQLTANMIITPDTLALSISLYAPTVVAPQSATPGTLALVITTYAPAITVAVAVVVITTTEESRALAYRRTQENREAYKVAQEGALRGSDAAYRELVAHTKALLPWEGSDASERAARAYAMARERDLAGDAAALQALKAKTAPLIPSDGWDAERKVKGDESGESWSSEA